MNLTVSENKLDLVKTEDAVKKSVIIIGPGRISPTQRPNLSCLKPKVVIFSPLNQQSSIVTLSYSLYFESLMSS